MFWKTEFRFTFSIVMCGAALFLCAGRLDWVNGWMFMALLSTLLVINYLILLWKNPELLRERAKPRASSESYDKRFRMLNAPLQMAKFIVPGFDVRFGWAILPHAAVLPGAILMVLGMALVSWSMLVNPHLEAVARIQDDRGHRVITDGPYRFVRHPFYAGLLLLYFAFPLMLRSGWTFVPVIIGDLLLVYRTFHEDRMLRERLDGYAQFAVRTRYRLIPGIW
jgi:protein-S-isoprenylcysteine O-methyltransferase Ste14